MKHAFALTILATALLTPAAAPGQSSEPEPTVLTLRPAGEPSPALMYRIVPPRQDLVPGNAALFYHRAIQMMQSTRSQILLQDRAEGKTGEVRFEDDISNWITGPLDQIPRDEARAQLALYANALKEVEFGARRLDCDWEYGSRPETIELLIPEIQESRSLARLTALKVRLAVLDGDFDEALHWLQTGYALARHVSEGPTIIQALVGIAISGIMNIGLQDLIQAEGAPNLYWAIATRPSPFIDMTSGLEGERTTFERMLPALKDLDGPPWSVDRGRQFARELQEVIALMSDGITSVAPIDAPAAGQSEPPLGPRLLMTAIVAKAYPEARQALLESGKAESEVEAMPTVQVVGLHAYRQYQALNDDMHKWMSLPYWQSYDGINAVQQGWTFEEKISNPGLALFSLLAPALNSVRVAQVRIDRQLAAYQTVEAIRMAAAEPGGSLPESLDALPVPAPLDPATGNPFVYALDGDTATLTAPMIPGSWDDRYNRLHYVLKLR